MISRRHVIRASGAVLALASSVAGTRGASGAPAAASDLRLGVLPFGSVHWVADVIRRHRLDQAHGFALQTSLLAASDASRVALLSHSVDVAVNDWPFVAADRGRGGSLVFAPFSSATGGVMVRQGSTVKTLADLAGLKLGVAGGAADKSWLIVQAAARRQGIDLHRQATLSYGAPPLLGGLLQKGTLDAVLTFWTNAARLEAAGCREAFSVGDCAMQLGLPARLDLVGYVFDGRWAQSRPGVMAGFLAASSVAMEMLRADDREWVAVRPQMDAPDDALFEALRRRFRAGIPQPFTPATAQGSGTAEAEAVQASQVLRAIGGVGGLGASGSAAGGGGTSALPPGVFWRGDNAG